MSEGRVLILFLSLTSAKSYNNRDISARIIDGDKINIKAVPYQCLLTVNDKPFCGCVIVSKKYVLSAAHCFASRRKVPLPDTEYSDERLRNDYENKKVRVGVTEVNESGRSYNIDSVITHEKYVHERNISSDICLVGVRPQIKFDSKVKSIQLHTGNVKPGVMVYVSGYGGTEQLDLRRKEVGDLKLNWPDNARLYGTTLIVYNFEDCMIRYNDMGVGLDDSFLCAYGADWFRSADVCLGDSGGPLVTMNKKQLIGLVSFNMGCGDPKNVPPVFTRIAKFAKWIEQNLRRRASFG